MPSTNVSRFGGKLVVFNQSNWFCQVVAKVQVLQLIVHFHNIFERN